jgi:hypothetical protein
MVRGFFPVLVASQTVDVGIGASSAKAVFDKRLSVATVARQRQAEFAPDSTSPIDASDMLDQQASRESCESDDTGDAAHATSPATCSLKPAVLCADLMGEISVCLPD